MNKLLLLLLLLPLAAACQGSGQGALQSRVLEATEDAFITSDIASAEDPQGLAQRNSGAVDFLQTGYAWKVQGEEQIAVVGLVKFDLEPMKGREVRSATLQLFALRADLAEPVRLVDVHLVEVGQWSEMEVTYDTRPTWAREAIATEAVYGGGLWYSWDVGEGVARMGRTGQISFAVGLRALEEGKGEQVSFAARESGSNAPRLIVTFQERPAAIPPYVWPLAGGGVLVVALLGFLLGRRWAIRTGPEPKTVSRITSLILADQYPVLCQIVGPFIL